MGASRLRVAVVGHVEWVRFARVAHIPSPGEIIHAHDVFEEPAGGGAVAAVQLARLAGRATLVTAFGDDEIEGRAVRRLGELGVDVWSVTREGPTRTGVSLVDESGERTITTFGERLHACAEDVVIDWGALSEMDAIYFTAGDLGALRAARSARVLVASPRTGAALGQGVPLDALVFSGEDSFERGAAEEARAEAALMVSTAGADGGSYTTRSGETGGWPSAPLPGDPVDSYGCGDSFAAGLTYALGAGLPTAEALTLAARCGAMCLTGSGPYSRQLTAAEL
jgi:ribokinase